MKDYPQNENDWANETYQAMKAAWQVITTENPFPNDKQKEKLIEIAASMMCTNRNIQDPKFIQHAKDEAIAGFMSDYTTRDPLAKINFTLCFVLAYFDAHLSLQMIEEAEAKKAIHLLKSDYDLSYTGENKSNVLSVNFTSKG